MLRRVVAISALGVLFSLCGCSTVEVQTWFRIRGVEISEAQALEIADRVNAQRSAGCDPWYEGACVPDNVSDVDCEGGSGNGPAYVKGPFGPVKWDHYDLDRNGNGIACD
jgi:hypothetical protein